MKVEQHWSNEQRLIGWGGFRAAGNHKNWVLSKETSEVYRIEVWVARNWPAKTSAALQLGNDLILLESQRGPFPSEGGYLDPVWECISSRPPTLGGRVEQESEQAIKGTEREKSETEKNAAADSRFPVGHRPEPGIQEESSSSKSGLSRLEVVDKNRRVSSRFRQL